MSKTELVNQIIAIRRQLKGFRDAGMKNTDRYTQLLAMRNMMKQKVQEMNDLAAEAGLTR